MRASLFLLVALAALLAGQVRSMEGRTDSHPATSHPATPTSKPKRSGSAGSLRAQGHPIAQNSNAAAGATPQEEGEAAQARAQDLSFDHADLLEDSPEAQCDTCVRTRGNAWCIRDPSGQGPDGADGKCDRSDRCTLLPTGVHPIKILHPEHCNALSKDTRAAPPRVNVAGEMKRVSRCRKTSGSPLTCHGFLRIGDTAYHFMGQDAIKPDGWWNGIRSGPFQNDLNRFKVEGESYGDDINGGAPETVGGTQVRHMPLVRSFGNIKVQRKAGLRCEPVVWAFIPTDAITLAMDAARAHDAATHAPTGDGLGVMNSLTNNCWALGRVLAKHLLLVPAVPEYYIWPYKKELISCNRITPT